VADEIEQPGGDRGQAAGPELLGDQGTDGPEASGRTTDQLTADTAATEPPVYAGVDRPRGLNAYFAPGGEDEATDERRADERRNLRLLLLMVAALVLIPTLLTIAALAQELIAHRGG
jgi:hypothetical protein